MPTIDKWFRPWHTKQPFYVECTNVVNFLIWHLNYSTSYSASSRSKADNGKAQLWYQYPTYYNTINYLLPLSINGLMYNTFATNFYIIGTFSEHVQRWSNSLMSLSGVARYLRKKKLVLRGKSTAMALERLLKQGLVMCKFSIHLKMLLGKMQY